MLKSSLVCCGTLILLVGVFSGLVRGVEQRRDAVPRNPAMVKRGQHTPQDVASTDAETAVIERLAKPTLTPADLELLGGWRVPAATRQPEYRSLAFGNGGLAVRADGAVRRFYTTHHNHLGGPIQELLATEAPGAAKTPVTAWPLLRVGQYLGDLYRPVRELHPNTAQPECTGVFLDGQRVIATGRAAYAVPPPEGPFLCVEGKPCGVEGGSPQLLGGGLCDIPPWFAEQFLGGKSLGVGFGGYCSGQGSSVGPSLYACSRELREVTSAVALLRFGALGTTDKRLREHRPPDYRNADNVWSLDPEGETGYWAADRVRAGPVWIETEHCSGMCYWVIQGCGELSYRRQTETFGETTRVQMYVYAPRDLAEVAQGSKQPYEPRAAFFDWDNAGLPGSVKGACWLPESRTLYLLLADAYPDGGEQLPVIAAFRVR